MRRALIALTFLVGLAFAPLSRAMLRHAADPASERNRGCDGNIYGGGGSRVHRFLAAVGAALMLATNSGPAQASSFSGAVLYVASNSGTISAYQIGTWQRVGQWSGLPFSDGVRGIASEGDYLYVAHGGDGGASGAAGKPGHLLKWDLTNHSVVYDRTYTFGIDQLAVCNGVIYMPVGELATSSSWETIDAATGDVTGSLTGGSHPHNTICQNGDVYMGGRNTGYLYQASGPRIGPTPSATTGVRPFTVNATGSRTWITWTKYRGFSVADPATGAVLASVNFGTIPRRFAPTSASHGISLNPAATEVYVLDTPYRAVRVYTASDTPELLATIPIPDGLTGKETPCPYDCPRSGWLLHSLDGRYVFVGDSGDVIDTASRSVVATIPPLLNNKHGYLEVDWANGAPVATSTHFGTGH